MIAYELINQMIPALKFTDLAEKAIIWMEELKTNHLPVVSEGQFKGIISEDILLENNNLDARIGDLKLFGENCYVFNNQHLFDIIRMGKVHGSEIVAIVDDKKNFLGVSSHADTINTFAKTLSVQTQGGILTLSVRFLDYSFAEISRIIESEGVKILGSYVDEHPTKRDNVTVTIKLNVTDLSAVVSALQRFKYEVDAVYHQSEHEETDLARIDNLLRFLEI